MINKRVILFLKKKKRNIFVCQSDRACLDAVLVINWLFAFSERI